MDASKLNQDDLEDIQFIIECVSYSVIELPSEVDSL